MVTYPARARSVSQRYPLNRYKYFIFFMSDGHSPTEQKHHSVILQFSRDRPRWGLGAIYGDSLPGTALVRGSVYA